MENPLDEMTEGVKEALENNDQALAASRIKEYLEKADNVPVNVAITGESGSGKSSFVNAFRGINDDGEDKRAAPTGCVETTMEVKDYSHPEYPNVILWDLPGIGTTNFPADKYLQHVGFERFDFFIIISDTRFRENDAKLALEIQKMDKKFYFARSKIDDNVRAEERKKGFDAKRLLAKIRENCIQGLQSQGIQSPQVFLLSSFDLHLHDFPALHETLEKELPAHKKDALLFAMPNISLEIINKKKEAFQGQITHYAFLSGVGALVPIPGFSVAVDAGLIATVVKKYRDGFGLDSGSLQRLADTSRVPLKDLRAVIRSPLALQNINVKLILRMLAQYAALAALMLVEEGLCFIPILGSMIAANISSVVTQKALNIFLDALAEDAQRVFKKALGLNTSV